MALSRAAKKFQDLAYEEITKDFCLTWVEENASKVKEAINAAMNYYNFYDIGKNTISYAAWYQPKVTSYIDILPTVKKAVVKMIDPVYATNITKQITF